MTQFDQARRAGMLAGTAIAAFTVLALPQNAMAEECVMEDAGTSTQSTQGAASINATATACGTEALAANSNSTAVGYQAKAALQSATVPSGFTDGAVAFGARAVSVG